MCPEEICSGRSRRSKLELATKATLSWCLWAGSEKHVEVFTSSTLSLDAQQTPTRLVHQQRKRSWRPCSFPEVQPLLCSFCLDLIFKMFLRGSDVLRHKLRHSQELLSRSHGRSPSRQVRTWQDSHHTPARVSKHIDSG